jgi:hypothetical protein
LRVIKGELKEQQKDLRAINNGLKYDSTNLELWQQKQSKLNDVLSTTKKRLDTQNLELEKAKTALELGTISTTEFSKLQRNIKYTESEISKLNNELDRTNSKIVSVGNINFDKFSKLGSTLTKSITLPIIGAVAALGTLAVKSENTADELYDSSTKIGLSVESLQEWNHAATLMGESITQLNSAFVKVNGILGDIASGDAYKVSEILEAIGLSVDDLKGKDTDQAFEIIRSALSNVKDETLKVGIANKLFGDKIGSELLPILSSEASAIKTLREEARSLGIITTEQAEITGSFNDSLDQVKQTLTSLGVELAVTVLPIMQILLEKLRDNIIPTISSWIEKWSNLNSGTKVVITTLTFLVAAIGPVLTVIGKVGPIVKIISASLKGVGVSGVIAGIGINFATLGIGALVALLATALMSSEKFRVLLAKLGQTLIDLLSPIMDIVTTLMDAFGPILQVIIDLFVMLVDILVPILDIILMPLILQKKIFASILELILPLLMVVANILKSILVPAIRLLQIILEPVLWVVEKIVGFISKIFSFAGNVTSKLSDLFGGFFGGSVNLKEQQNRSVTTNNKSSSSTVNNVTVNTTSSTFDIDSINKALGGSYI